MYRIMVVDDEAEIREGIVKKIRWEDCGFTLVGEAENGRDALEIAQIQRPEVVMSDIQMPFMDGLTMGKELVRTLPDVKLVFFSGFDDFEYAQKAIALSAVEYILKPINAAELTELLLRLREQLDAEWAEKRDVQQLRERYEESLPVLRDMFYSRVLEGRLSRQQLLTQAAQYDISTEGEAWVAVQFLPESDSTAAQVSPELMPLSVQRMLEQELMPLYVGRIFLYNDGVAGVFCLGSKERLSRFSDKLLQVVQQMKRVLDITVTAGVGSVAEEFSQLHLSAGGARSALEYRVLAGTGRVIFIDDIEPESAAGVTVSENVQRALTTAVKLGDPEQVADAVSDLISSLRSAKIGLGEYRLYVMELMSELFKIVRTYRLEPAEVFGKDYPMPQKVFDFDSLDAMGQWFTELCERACGLIRRERTNSSKALVERAKVLIAEQYQNPELSVETMCAHLYVSAAYFSTIFKKATGQSFVSYLTEVRLQAAVELLNTSELKTYEISSQVGYTEPNYFSYVFKKQFGRSPTKYRSQRS